MDTLGSRAWEGNERVNTAAGVEGREPDPSLVVVRELGVGGREGSSSMGTFLNLRRFLSSGHKCSLSKEEVTSRFRL